VKDKKWIQDALSGKKGSLRATAKRKGLLKGEDDTLSKTDLKKLQKMGGKTAKRAYLAETLSKFDDGGGVDVDADTPKIYVADLAAYNEGKLIGEWIDLSDYNEGSEVMKKISSLLKKWSAEQGEEREEYAIHDIENFPRELYSEYMGEGDFDKVIKLYNLSVEKDIPLDVLGSIEREYSPEDMEEFLNDRYEGYFENDTDLGYHLVDMMGGIENLGEKTLGYYFDYEAYGRDVAINDFNSYDGYHFKSYKKGGKIDAKKYFKQGGEVSRKKDGQRIAKPSGWRWKDEAMDKGIIRKSSLYKTPSRYYREKYPDLVYYEGRSNKSDKKPSRKYISL
jgi:antirestriction protein